MLVVDRVLSNLQICVKTDRDPVFSHSVKRWMEILPSSFRTIQVLRDKIHGTNFRGYARPLARSTQCTNSSTNYGCIRLGNRGTAFHPEAGRSLLLGPNENHHKTSCAPGSATSSPVSVFTAQKGANQAQATQQILSIKLNQPHPV